MKFLIITFFVTLALSSPAQAIFPFFGGGGIPDPNTTNVACEDMLSGYINARKDFAKALVSAEKKWEVDLAQAQGKWLVMADSWDRAFPNLPSWKMLMAVSFIYASDFLDTKDLLKNQVASVVERLSNYALRKKLIDEMVNMGLVKIRTKYKTDARKRIDKIFPTKLFFTSIEEVHRQYCKNLPQQYGPCEDSEATFSELLLTRLIQQAAWANVGKFQDMILFHEEFNNYANLFAAFHAEPNTKIFLTEAVQLMGGRSVNTARKQLRILEDGGFVVIKLGPKNDRRQQVKPTKKLFKFIEDLGYETIAIEEKLNELVQD